ncbi:MAG: LLM class flavin-dependent oxidoreductase [Acidimicrobiales bacterium]
MIDEVKQAESLGLGACFISERFNIKEAATLSGAVGAVSGEHRIITGATNHNIRHPMVTASYASTMHFLTDGRFLSASGRHCSGARCLWLRSDHYCRDGGLRLPHASSLERRNDRWS